MFFKYAAFCFGASKWCFPSRSPHRAAPLALSLLLACGASPDPGPRPYDEAPSERFQVVTAKPPAAASPERPCAWYGDAHGGVLYFGESAFWSGARTHDTPLGELEHLSARRIGRFDLAAGRMLPALALAQERPSGTWDVLAPGDGHVYFTTFFDFAGSVNLATGNVVRFVQAGKGLNEWALGPDDTLLASRYAGADGTSGSLAWLERDGTLRADFPLEAPTGFVVAPKTVAMDPGSRVVWITTDLLKAKGAPKETALPTGAGAHPTLIVDLAGRERARIEDVEIQFARFGPDGTGYFALVEGSALKLVLLPPGAGPAAFHRARRIGLDEQFEPAFDFAQDIRVEEGGRVLVTTWSGGIYVVEPHAPRPMRRIRFPRLARGGLYYAAASVEERLCATYCEALTVVCTQLE